MVSKMKITGLLLLLVSILLLSACGSGAAKSPTPDANAIYTAAAQTVQAELTQVAALTPSATVTPQPTATRQPTATVAVSPTLAATLPAGLPGAGTSQARPTVPDKAEWIANTPADNAVIAPGEKFQIVWRVKNTGTTTWTTQYTYRFFGGDRFHTQDSYNLSAEVKPNEEARLVVDAVAPTSAGEYRTNWVLTNAEGVNFYPIYLIIKVQTSASTSAPTATQTSVPPSETPTP